MVEPARTAVVLAPVLGFSNQEKPCASTHGSRAEEEVGRMRRNIWYWLKSGAEYLILAQVRQRSYLKISLGELF
jgi:hypothetical protein